jgi:hypothetical protein
VGIGGGDPVGEGKDERSQNYDVLKSRAELNVSREGVGYSKKDSPE